MTQVLFQMKLENETKPYIVIRFQIRLAISLFMEMRLPLEPKDLWKKHGKDEQVTHYIATSCKIMNPMKF
jgi:hypothetical protein